MKHGNRFRGSQATDKEHVPMTNATQRVFGSGFLRLSLFVLAFLVPSTAGYASLSAAPADSVHFCVPLDIEEM